MLKRRGGEVSIRYDDDAMVCRSDGRVETSAKAVYDALDSRLAIVYALDYFADRFTFQYVYSTPKRGIYNLYPFAISPHAFASQDSLVHPLCLGLIGKRMQHKSCIERGTLRSAQVPQESHCKI